MRRAHRAAPLLHGRERSAARTTLRRHHTRLWLLLGVISAQSLAGGRARTGGTLRVTAIATALTSEPLLADTPVDATVLELTRPPLCRLVEAARTPSGALHLTLPVGVAAPDVIASLTRARGTSPYRGLVAQVKTVAQASGGVEVTFDAAAPDFERALCHVAFATAPGPFAQTTLAANPNTPEGRPFVDGASVQLADPRVAERLLSQRRTHVVLGATSQDDGPQLFATYLSLPTNAPPELRRAIDATIERADLTRFFVRAPAAPLSGALPPSLGGPQGPLAKGIKPAPLSPPRELSLFYDATNDDHRAVAERLQVKLQPFGFRLALKPVSKLELRATWALGSEFSMQTVLLPPAPGPALAVVLELAHQHDRIAPTLASVNALVDQPSRDRLARETAVSVQAGLDVIPLYVQGVGFSVSRDVQHLSRDPLGVPRLDDVFLSAE